MLALAWTATLVWAVAMFRRWKQEQQSLRRWLEILARREPEQLLWEPTLEQLPRLPQTSPLRKPAERLVDSLRSRSEWLQSQSHQRAAVEVRAARAGAELRRLQEIFSNLPSPVIALDEYNELVLANHSAAELLGLGDGPVEKRALDSLTHCEKLVELLSAVAQHKGTGSRNGEIELADRQGCSHLYRVMAARLGGEAAGEHPEHEGTVAVFEDISEQKTFQKRNAEFVSAASHEMKTPLAGIKAYVELLADGDAEDEATREEFLSVINGQADRLQRLIDNLLNLARIEAGVVKVSKQHQSLNALLEEALHVVQPSAEAKQISLSGELSPMYLGVHADRDMLLQAAINLLSNAVKYTHPGGKVTLRSRLVDDQLRFEVSDSGVGISAEDCPRVFEKFYRVNKDKKMASGTGLGLPLAKHIVEDVHGGRLTLESTVGVGSTFIVTLPVAGARN